MLEIWKPIKGYENYMVSSLGNIKRLNYNHTGKERILKPCIESGGYLQVHLGKEGKIKNFLIHRLVAEAFIDNPDNLKQVNHKDFNKQNNSLQNLEWCDAKYNITYSQATKIKCLDLKTNKETIYLSIHEAGRELNINQGSIWYSIYKYNSPYKNRYIFSIIENKYKN